MAEEAWTQNTQVEMGKVRGKWASMCLCRGLPSIGPLGAKLSIGVAGAEKEKEVLDNPYETNYCKPEIALVQPLKLILGVG